MHQVTTVFRPIDKPDRPLSEIKGILRPELREQTCKDTKRGGADWGELGDRDRHVYTTCV